MVLINPDEFNTSENSGPNSTIKLKTPKRILHFSDGILEEYSDEEEDTTQQEQAVVDPNSLTWGPWLWYKTWRAGASTVGAIDYMGEFLAAFFGITTPKYYFELEEYKRRTDAQRLETESKKGWSESATGNFAMKEINTEQPKPVEV